MRPYNSFLFFFLSCFTTFSSRLNTYNGGFLSPLSQWHRVPFGIPYRLQNSPCESPECSLISLIVITVFLFFLFHPFFVFCYRVITFFYFLLKPFLFFFHHFTLVFNFVYNFVCDSFVILSRLVDTFFSRISPTMQLPPKHHSIAYVLPWAEGLHWQSRSSGCSNS